MDTFPFAILALALQEPLLHAWLPLECSVLAPAESNARDQALLLGALFLIVKSGLLYPADGSVATKEAP